MSKFLTTTGVSHYLEQLIKQAGEKLILISPFLKINDKIKSSLEEKNRFRIDIRLVYGKNELQPEENNWLKNLKSIRASFLKNLHAKCYLNESQAIITSMNLYEFSQVNNEEMGILVIRDQEPELYNDIFKEAMRLIRNSDEIEITVSRVPKSRPKKTTGKKKELSGHCIRCKTSIKLNPLVPYCKKCFSSWKMYSNKEYQEKNCHICGKATPTSMLKPSCYPCFNSNKSKLKFSTIGKS